MQFELFVAARYLRAKRRQAVIGVITAISIIGVVAGVASLIIALGVLVDVPVVAADGINRELHRGEPRLRAAWLGRSICGTR